MYFKHKNSRGLFFKADTVPNIRVGKIILSHAETSDMFV